VSQPEWISSVKPCLRGVGEKGRLFPNGKRVEVVFAVKAVNFLLLRTEGPGDINEATLPKSGISVPVIQPQKIMAVVRRRMLQLLRQYRDSGADLRPFILKAKEMGFRKAEEHLTNGWECTIQPPLASGGEKATDLGIDGYCPACTIFGAALTQNQYEEAGGTMSIGLKSRVHFDPAFATTRAIQPETHNKVSEGYASTTGGALFSDVHVMPGTVFMGRVVLHDVTLPELLAVLYSLATTEEIGGRSSIFGGIRMELLGIRCGNYSKTTALELAEEYAGRNVWDLEGVLKRLNELGFSKLSNEDVTRAVNPIEKDGIFKELWQSSIDYVEQMHGLIQSMRGEGQRGKGRRGGKRQEASEEQ